MSKPLLTYLLSSGVKNLYTVLRSNTAANGVHCLTGPAMKPKKDVDSYFKTPYTRGKQLSVEGEFSQQMMGVKVFKPYKHKESYFQ